MTIQNIEQKTVFMIGQGADGVPVLILGVPAGAWHYMKGGNTTHFDLMKGPMPFPLKVIMFGGKDHAEVMKTVNEAMAQGGGAYLDERRRDMGITPEPKE